MKNIFLSAAMACISILTANTASAQFNYTLTTLTDTYTPLTGATSVSNGAVWNSDSMFVMPVGFTVNMNGITTDSLHLLSGGYVLPELSAVQSGWVITGASMSDRGIVDGIGKSDIRYQTVGTPGNRIFKLEVFNAGFDDEYVNYGDLKDSINYQMWVYETTNVVEFRYGSSDINYFNDYFGNKMLVGFLKDVDTATGNYQKFYTVSGSSTVPTLDSFAGLPGNVGISDVPQEGRVFRFAYNGNGNPTSVKHVAAGTAANVYPTMVEAAVNVELKSAKPVTYTIVSSNGQVMRQLTTTTAKTTIDMSGFAPGLYTISILDSDKNYEVHKVMKM